MRVSVSFLAFAAGLAAVASASQAAVLVQADLSTSTATPRLTLSGSNGTDPHGYGTNVNIDNTSIDSIGVFSTILSSSEYLGGNAVTGGGGVDASSAAGQDGNNLASGSTGVVARTFAAPASTAGTLTVTGFAFASSNTVTAPRTGSMRFAVQWLGANGVSGGSGANADTYLMNGSNAFIDVDATVYTTAQSGVYYVALATADQLTLPITTNDGTSIVNGLRVELKANDSGSIRLRNSTNSTGFSASRFTIAGTFAVPEPASLSLMAVAGGALMRRRRR